MNAAEVARDLGVNEKTVRRAIYAGRLTAEKRNARCFDIDLEAARTALKGSLAAALHEALETLSEVGFGVEADSIRRRYGV